MRYVDGFVVPVSTAEKQRYIEHATEMAGVFKEYGASQVVETWADDVPPGEVTSFPMAVQCQDGESVVFSWVIWPDKQTRQDGWAKMMEDPRMDPSNTEMPFDGKRLIYGGFDMVVEV